jgi:hypothetical protein
MYLTMMEPHTYPLPDETISDDLNLHNFLAEFDLEYDDALDPTSNKVSSDERDDLEEINEDEINVEPTPVTYSKPQAQHSPCARNSSLSLASCLGLKSTQSGFRNCSIGTLLVSSLQITSVTSIGSLATINPTTSCDINESFHAPPSLNRQVTPPPTIPAPKPFSHRRVSSRTRKRKAKDSDLFSEKENISSISKISSCQVRPPQSVVVTPLQKEKKTSDVDVAQPDDSKNKASKKKSRSSKSKKSPKKKRARRTDPKIKEYVVKGNLDVLLGRGGCSNHHPGNTAYRQHILSLQKKYKALSREEKTAFSKEVLRWLHDHGGRFLKRDERGGPWYIVTDGTARQKVSQALREDHTPEGRAYKKARTNSSKKPETCAGGGFMTGCMYVL